MKKVEMLKIIVLGDAGVGKTCLLNQYVKSIFSQQYKATIGADFLKKEIVIDNESVQLQLWDTAGQEQFNSMGTQFYRGTEACVLVFDLTSIHSFEKVENWREQFLTNLSVIDPDNFPFILLGNKSDLANERQVTEASILQYCSAHKNMKYFEVSAKESLNIDVAFSDLSKRAKDKKGVSVTKLVPNVVIIKQQETPKANNCICK